MCVCVGVFVFCWSYILLQCVFYVFDRIQTDPPEQSTDAARAPTSSFIYKLTSYPSAYITIIKKSYGHIFIWSKYY